MINRVQGIPKSRPFLDDVMRLSPEGRAYFEGLERRVPIYGNGAPEGLVAAAEGSTYYDLGGVTGSIHYVKMVNSVNGNEAEGWTLA